MINRNQKLTGIFSLLLATVIWGFAFIAQSVGMERIGPFTFQAVRCLLAVLFLFPCSFIMELGRCTFSESVHRWADPKLWKIGAICGCALFIAASLQQVGLVSTDAGKAGFITAMYIVLVPVLGVFLGEKIPKATVISVALAVAGLFLLSCVGVTEVNSGDLLLLGCAFAFAVQITCIDRLAGGLDCIRLNCIQALIVSILSAISMGLAETFVLEDILSAWAPLLFAGVLSMGLAYSLQIVGQHHLEPAPASLIMSLESVFAAIGGWWLLHERMKSYELLGCGLVFAAVILSQIPIGQIKNK